MQTLDRFQQTKHVLGSTAYITVVTPSPSVATKVIHALWQQIADFEQRFSRFLPTSELSLFNAKAGEWYELSSAFAALLQAAKDWSQKTNGLYNPLILPALQQAGYKGSWPNADKPTHEPRYETGHMGDWQAIELKDTKARIPAGTALDFGGIGKGYLLDQLSTFLHAQHMPNFWISLGGDVVCSGHDLHDEPWCIGIQHAIHDNQQATTAVLHDEPYAVATSGITKRRGTHAGSAWHHIIDPRTSKPAATDVLTATVCAPTATAADIAAKCLVIAGSSHIPDTIKHLGVPHAFIQYDPSQHQPSTHKTGDIWS